MVLNIRPMTADEFEDVLSLPENADRLLELINGEMVEKVPTQLHAFIASLFNAVLFLYVQSNPIGWVFSELRIKLPDDAENDLIPDIAFVLKAGRTFDPDAPLTYMPDLVIEIQSPGQNDKFMFDKASYYLAHGTRLVWIVYPSKRIVEALTTKTRDLLTERDILKAVDLLPGFSLPVADIFRQV
jgi:Uma2 family endonuclease